jgi:hypothetical protein
MSEAELERALFPAESVNSQVNEAKAREISIAALQHNGGRYNFGTTEGEKEWCAGS